MKIFPLSLFCLSLMACRSETVIDGTEVSCIGAWDDPDPHYVYETSGRNVALGIIFFQMIFPPILVLVYETRCPIGKRTTTEPVL